MKDINYEKWAADLMWILDQIELAADDEETVRALCRHRFDVARTHGLTIEFLGSCQVGTA